MRPSELFKDVNPAIRDNLGKPRAVLAIGRGVAETAECARTSGANVVAFEVDPAMLSRARDVADEAHAFGSAPAEAWKAIEGKLFDLVILEDGAAHTRDALESAKSKLSDGGHALIAFGTSEDPDRVAGDVEAAGFEVMRLEVNPRVISALAAVGPEAVAELKKVHTTSFRYTREVLLPLERLAARVAPRALADGYVLVARLPPARRKLSLTVGMLTLNEKESVERMIDDIRAIVPDAKILLIDSSSDETPELAKAKGARVVRQLPPRGHGPAMERLMYEAASESDALIYIDCDFTYPTNVIGQIREMLEAGADVVNATRTSKYPKAMPVPNFMANRLFAGTASMVHGLPTTDVHSGLRGYRSSVIRGFAFDGEGDAIPLDTLILPARSNYNVIEFPIEYSERVGVSKLAKLRGTIWTFIRIARAVGKGDRVRRGKRYVVRDAE